MARMIATGEKISAQKCLDWGLCNRVVPADQLPEAAVAWAEELAAKAPLSLRYAKQAVAQAGGSDLGQTISDEADLQRICLESDDVIEGATAFMEKRAPDFRQFRQ